MSDDTDTYDTADRPTAIIEQNNSNLHALAEEVGLADEFDDVTGGTKGFFDHRQKAREEDLDEDERLALLFKQNAEIILALATEMGVPDRKLDGKALSAVDTSKFTLQPESSQQRAARKAADRGEKAAAAGSTDGDNFTLDPRRSR
jgi:hypothetical protein